MLPNGTQTYVQEMSLAQYRSFFMSSLYGPTSDLPPPGPPYAAPINLSSAFNLTGIVANFSTFSGGLDSDGNALSGDMLGTTLPTADSALQHRADRQPATSSAPWGRPSPCRRPPTPL